MKPTISATKCISLRFCGFWTELGLLRSKQLDYAVIFVIAIAEGEGGEDGAKQ